MSPARLSAVLFDLDGTLIATKRLYLECYRRALAPFVGRSIADEELLALGPRSETRMLRELAGEHAIEACIEEFYRHYESLHDELFRGIYDGVPEMLEGLRRTGLRTGIVTGKSRRSWDITALRAELGPFDVLVFDDDVAAAKPDPSGLLLALDRLGAEPEAAIYIGDSASDLRAARAAAALPGAALWSHPAEVRRRFEDRARAEGAVLLESPGAVLALARERAVPGVVSDRRQRSC